MMRLLLQSATLAAISLLAFSDFVNPITTKSDEGIVVALFTAIVVVWGLLSAFLYARVDEEWKKTQTAVLQDDFETFRVEAPKRIPRTFQMLYVVVAGITVLTSWGFHIASLITLLIFFWFNFLVAFVYFVIKDLDDPLSGVVNVEGIPKEWLEKLSEKRNAKTAKWSGGK